MGTALAPLEAKYEILAKIKEGGMGAIYKVRHRLLEEVRVVKALRQQFEDDADLQQRFIHEARSAIRLRHPNVVQIFDFLLEDGQGFIVMEYIDGVDLAEFVQEQRRPSLPLFFEIARQGLRALGYLHQQGFVHRDISPDNLMLGADFDGSPLVKMIDLGIAKKLDGGVNLTASGMYLGKFRYSSPEHFGSQGADGIEPRSDLYSFGVVLYEFLTGSYPIQGTEPSQLIAGHLFHPPMAFEEADPEGRVPKALREILLKVLDKDPERRYTSAADFAGALRQLQAQFPITEATVREATQSRQASLKEEPVDREAPGDQEAQVDHAPPPAASIDPLRSSQIEALLGGAKALFRVQQPLEARKQLQAILDLEPNHPRSLELLREIDGELAVAQDETVTWTESAPIHQEQVFDQHLQAACALAEEGNHAGAIPHFEAALKIQDDNETVRHMLVEARENLEVERRVSEQRLADEVQQLKTLLGSGDLEKTRERLTSARRAYGDIEPLREIDREMAASEARRQAQLIEETLIEAGRQRETGELTTAVRKLESAREVWKSSPVRENEAGQDLLARLDEEEALLEKAHREAAELDETLFNIKELIEEGKLVEADRVLYQAVEAFGKQEELVELRGRLDELYHQGLTRQVRGLIDEAGRLGQQNEFSGARKALEKARVMASELPEIQTEIAAQEGVLTAARAAAKAQLATRLAGEIEELIDGQNLEQAQAHLAAAETEVGEPSAEVSEVFELLRLRIADGFQERVNALIHEAGVALEAGRYHAALPFLEQALELSPGDDWIKDRLSQARLALTRDL